MTRAIRSRPPARNKRAEIDLVLAAIDAATRTASRRDALIEFLRDEHPMYRDRSAIDVMRLRGFVMRTFADVGLPGDALSFVLEDLQSSVDAYAVAAAAQALRGWTSPSHDVIPLLRQARENIQGKDEFVSFAAWDAPGHAEDGTTATAELEKTLHWLENAVPDSAATPGRLAQPEHCCCCREETVRQVHRSSEKEESPPLRTPYVVFEDHDGRSISFPEMLTGLPSVVTFFYTRCENPRKCSLTIQKLGRVQAGLAALGVADRVHIAAVTYDPRFDTPARLRAYAEARHFVPNEHHRLLRAPDGMQTLQDYFALGVNYVQSLVNRHRVELYVLDDRARVVASFLRLEWNEQDVVSRVTALIRPAA